MKTECKRCGLLRSTVDNTNAKCIPDKRMGTVLEGVHDFPIGLEAINNKECNKCGHGMCRGCNYCHNEFCSEVNLYPSKACFDTLNYLVNTQRAWEKSFVNKFFVYRLNGDVKDHVGAEKEAIEFIKQVEDDAITRTLLKINPVFTQEEMKKAHDDNGSCGSCNWHALFHEHEYDRTENKDVIEYWDACQNSEIGDEAESHRGCYIYPTKKNTYSIFGRKVYDNSK